MASKVYYAKFGKGETQDSICKKTRAAFRAAGLAGALVADEWAAVKTHFGEAGNRSYIPPALVKTVVDEVRAAGAKPCLVETSTLYRGERSNAYDHFSLAVAHGFGPEAMGCPLFFLDGLRGNVHVEQQVGLKHCETVAVAGDFPLIPSAVVVTHLTGHLLGGLGGAIKNVAMGLASRAGKLRQHSAGHPQVSPEDCIACATCEKWCPAEAISVPEKATIDHDTCIGCGECLTVCPVGAIGFEWDEPAESFNEKMAEYAFGILKGKEGRAAFLTFVLETTRDCNCMGHGGKKMCPDLGILASTDPVAVDKASIDLIDCADVFPGTIPEGVTLRPGDGHILQRMWGKDPCEQLRQAETLGLGKLKYTLRKTL
jgi:uncharacterized Fe-S center protein